MLLIIFTSDNQNTINSLFMRNLSFLLLAFLLPFTFFSCNNEEGEGGTGTVQGYVKLVMHPDDDFNLITDTVNAAKTDVFIVYGDDDFYGDDVETDATGFFRFNYLTPGDYTVFSYSILPSGEKQAVSQTVSLERHGTAHVPTLYIHEGKAYGTSIITGKVWASYYHNGDFRGEGWAYEHRVYIRRVGEEFHFDDVRVGADGSFAFQKISPGVYEIFTFTEDFNEIPEVLMQTIVVNEAGQVFALDETFIVIVNV